MSLFDLINPFSYITPIHADDEPVESESAVVVAADVVEAEVEVIESVEASNADSESNDEEEEQEEEEEEEDEEEEDEEQEDEDPAEAIKAACGETMSCKSLKHHYEECAARVENGSKESCAEELLHFMHCVDHCAAEKIFAKLK
ncbi:ubiquinol--cytochrome-c reductase subunit 6 [Coemansia brasiliensis]|uniref:Ubiquinol--cytochrome-c reductase subunit 6 n=1 Tax=Coemansia brasiliensis TaxID=2650707 RepID=A0A9W8ID24_9FUNG|nr:ubiquinol--cytochrome-c reductase subunit 6 [Coemansia brasiliensis]